MRRFRTYHEVRDPAGEEVLAQVLEQRRRLTERLAGVRRVVPVVSGKGGVGKSAITANLAALLASRGRLVGAVDADFNGPSLARMLGAANNPPLRITETGITPAAGVAGVKFVSMDLLLAESDTPLRWRGPEQDAFLWRGALEAGTLREFLGDIDWGDLDYLFVDVPPGTDRIERLLELVPNPSAVLLVATPSGAAIQAVARSARLLSDLGVGPVGLVLNMTRYRCPVCGNSAPIFRSAAVAPYLDGGELEPWAEIPFDPDLGEATDDGRPFALAAPDAPASASLIELTERLEKELPDEVSLHPL